MNNKLLFICLFLLFTGSSRLTAQITFQKLYGGTDTDFLTDIEQTNDSGYIMAGQTRVPGTSNYDGYLVKTKANGDTLWTKVFGGAGGENIQSAKQTKDSGYIYTGYTTSLGSGFSRLYLGKLNKTGQVAWQKTYAGLKGIGGADVLQTKNGGYIVVGTTDSLSSGQPITSGVYILKTDANGDSVWTRAYNGADGSQLNSAGPIISTYDDGYMITGSGVARDSSSSDIYLLKIDSLGRFKWDRFIGGTGDESGNAVHQTTDSGYVVSAITTSFSDGGANYYLVKTDSSGNVQWSKTYGSGGAYSGSCSGQTSNGGYFIMGAMFPVGPSTRSYVLVKTDEHGDTAWAKSYGPASSYECGVAGRQTTDGGYVVAGWTVSFLAGGIDMLVVKTDNNGVTSCNQAAAHVAESSPLSYSISQTLADAIGGGTASAAPFTSGSTGTAKDLCAVIIIPPVTFEKTYGGTNLDYGMDIQQTVEGGYIIAGSSASYTNGGRDGYLIKTDAKGDTMWTRTFGGPNDDEFYSVKQTKDSGFIMTGYTSSFGAGGSDIYIIKTDSNGVPVWQKTFGGAKSDAGSEVIVSNNGNNYVVVGSTDSINGSNPTVKGLYIINLNSDGDSVWTRVYNGADGVTTVGGGGGIDQTFDGGYIIAGSGIEKDSVFTDVFLLKIDANGDFVWDKFMGTVNPDGAGSVMETTDHGFILGGTSNFDLYAIKTNSSGVPEWAKTFGGGNTDEGAAAGQTKDGGYYITGDEGSYGPKSYVLIKLDANGDTVWTKAYGKAGTADYGMGAAQTSDNGFILNGWGLNMHPGGLFDMYVVKTDSNGVSDCNSRDIPSGMIEQITSSISLPLTKGFGGVFSTPASIVGNGATVYDPCPPVEVINQSLNHNVVLYPNPAGDQLRIDNTELTMHNAQCTITNILGQNVLPASNFTLPATIDISQLPQGIYFVTLLNAQEKWTGKFIKE